MTLEATVVTLSHDEARSLTDEVKHDSERLWRKLVELYDGGAHLALGYRSWGAYFKTEFGQSERHGYRLLDAGKALEIVASDPRVTVPNERQARELAPLLDDPPVLNEAWEEAVNSSSNGKPTAVAVKEVVGRRVVSQAEREEMLRLREQGTSVAKIAATVGWSQQTVSRVTAEPTPKRRLARRQSSATAQTRALAKIHQTCREWQEAGDEEYIPAPELARRIRVIDEALTFLTKKQDAYKEVAPNGNGSR